MKLNKNRLLLYAITERSLCKENTFYKKIEDALRAGVTILQLREKNLPEEQFLNEAIQVKKLCRKYNVPLIINDSVEVAIKSGADGVHVGIDDTAVSEIRKRVPVDFIIGATAKTVEQAQNAEKDGADYIGVGAVFPSSTKRNAIRVSREQLKEIADSVSIPAVAVGGIGLQNIDELKGCGISGVAVVSSLFACEDTFKATEELLKKLEAIKAEIKTALTIAGSDSSGGAGIQADIKTMTVNGVYAMSAVTALTAQNTTGVSAISEVSPDFLKAQLDAVFTDIKPDAVKIGMVSNSKLIEAIAERLTFYKAENIVVDPVMVATSGAELIQSEAVSAMKSLLFPMATLITPNIPEAQVLTGMKIECEDDMIRAATCLNSLCGCAVLIKGGHSISDANDLLCENGNCKWFYGKRINNPNTHGTGCTLSSAIAANLAKGYSLEASVQLAKEYISGALSAMLDLGKGKGPMNHAFDLNGKFAKR